MEPCHPTDDDFGRYYLGIAKDYASQLEEHLISCPACVNRAEVVESYFDSVRRFLFRRDVYGARIRQSGAAAAVGVRP
ncbi:MAG: hypothetical protein ABJF23_17075 [Bryobacteraceae bacterium]